jgi:hypothetical protein
LVLDVPRVRKLVEETGGAIGTADDFCALPHEVPFTVTVDDPPSAGSAVTLIGGEPPYVLSRGLVIGRVMGKWAEHMNACLALGWELSGVLVGDAADDPGLVRVQGRR